MRIRDLLKHAGVDLSLWYRRYFVQRIALEMPIFDFVAIVYLIVRS